MIRTMFMLVAVLIAAGCSEEASGPLEPTGAERGAESVVGEKQSVVNLAPSLRVVGAEDIFDELDVTRIAFDAELYLLPIDPSAIGAGDAVDMRIQFRDGEMTDSAVSRSLVLGSTGLYRVLLRVYRRADGVSVDVDGALRGPKAATLSEDLEPAPTAADSASEDACEPAPTAADDMGEAEDADECEPAPTAASDDETMEPAPTAADEMDESEGAMEPAPTAAEPAPTPARQTRIVSIELDDDDDDLAYLTLASMQEFEFYAGTVEVGLMDRELVVAWDVRSWLRTVLAEPLGVSEVETRVEPIGPTGFQDAGDQFELFTSE